MNLYLSTGTQVATFALDVTITDTGLTYKTYPAFLIEDLKTAWRQQIDTPMFAPMNTPTPDEKPLWTTDKYAVYNHINVIHNDDYEDTVVVPHQEEKSITFDNITKLSDYSDHAIYQIYTPASPSNIVEKPNNFIQLTGRHQPTGLGQPIKTTAVTIFNSVAHTATSKFGPLQYSALTGNGTMIAIVVPLADMPPSEWDFVFSMADEGLLKINSSSTVTPLAGLGALIKTHMPKVAFNKNTATVDADGYVDLEFSLVTAQGAPLDTEHNAFVYLKTTAGVLNKQQVKTVGGKGKVRVIASHLEAGDVATVSCGFQYWSGTDDCIVTVK